MKRYTLLFDNTVAYKPGDNIKGMIEDILLGIHPRITYKIGQAKATGDCSVIAEILVGSNKADLDGLIKKALEGSPWTLTALHWGWESPESPNDTSNVATLLSNRDPLMDSRTLDVSEQFLFNKNAIISRFVLVNFLSLIFIAAIAGRFYYHESILMDGIYLLIFMIWLFEINANSILFNRYPLKIDCGQSLGVTYWLRRKTAKIEWWDIWGLDHTDPVCKLLTRQGTIRFILTEKTSGNLKKSVLQAIVRKANLKYVSGNLYSMMYRHPDAPSK